MGLVSGKILLLGLIGVCFLAPQGALWRDSDGGCRDRKGGEILKSFSQHPF